MGHITEGPGFNVGFVWEDYIYTPANNCLNGVTMSVVEDISKENNVSFIRCPIRKEKFISADEVFIASSSGGVTATQHSGPVTQMLIEEYEKKKDEYATNL